MTDRPIIFSGPMVLALIREAREPGTGKTQTRRVLRPRLLGEIYRCASTGEVRQRFGVHGMTEGAVRAPYAVGDRLWAREAWTHDASDLDDLRAKVEDAYPDFSYGPFYRATEPAPDTMRWRPSIHMPRWASRLTLIVTDVRVERLNAISEADARAEGVEPICDHGVGNQHLHRIAFEHLWCGLHGDCAWTANPWVVAVTFRPVLANIDALPAEQGDGR